MSKRVLTVAPMPPEKSAYALARYSRSPDSIRDSIKWVQSHDSAKFLESFYFQYGHASIADLGHLMICFEGISELAATEIEDEQLWDGQARSSRYQDFARSGYITPAGFDETAVQKYQKAAEDLLESYRHIHAQVRRHFEERLPRPEGLKPDAYARNIAARAYDVARYCLFFGISTGIGQVVSIRTLERQIRRLKASEYQELVDLGDEIAQACAEPPACTFGDGTSEPLAPTLARHVARDEHVAASRRDLRLWAKQNLPVSTGVAVDDVDLMRPSCTPSDVAATLLYPVTNRSYRDLYQTMLDCGSTIRAEVIDVALRSRARHDELLRGFRGGPYVYDISMDIGAYRDLHRHRRCYQSRQDFGTGLGYATPETIIEAGLGSFYLKVMEQTYRTVEELSSPGTHYLLPFAAKSRFLFKMDFAEAEYIARLRSGVKGHFSYRNIAWQMREKILTVEPELGRLVQATPPWVEDPLQR